MMNGTSVMCNMCYQPTTQVPGYNTPTCVKCSENLSRSSSSAESQQFFLPPPQTVIESLQTINNQPMAPPALHITTISNDQQQHQQLGAQLAHHKKFTPATAATNISSTFELEQALINMDGEILLGEEGQCPLCQKVFNRKTSLLNHIRNHSADKKYVCGYCQKGFSQQANLRNHERIHTNDRPYVCNDCGKAFTQITNLNNHRRLHTGERPFVCIEVNCGRSFAQVTNLNNHMKTHHKIQQYVCSQCPKKFHTVTQLNHHLGTHGITIKTQIAPRGDFACNLCPSFFNDESQLKRHLQRHSEGRFFPCSVIGCTDTFSTKNQLNKHLQNQHPHEYHRKKESRQVPLSLLQLSGSHYSPVKTKIKVEEDVRISPQSHITQIPIQIAGHNGTIAINLSSPYHHHHSSFNGEHLLTNGIPANASDAQKKVLSNHLNFSHFLDSFSQQSCNSSPKFVCNFCCNVFKSAHTLNKHIQKLHG